MISMIAKMAWIRRQEQENSTCSDSECYEDLHVVGEDYLEAVLLLNRQKGNVRGVDPVSYTHLDVYKRQILHTTSPAFTTH